MPAKPEKKGLDLDVLIAETNNEPYTFTLERKERTLPHPKNLTLPQLELFDRGQFAEGFPLIADPETAEALIALPAFALEAVVEGWLEHGGLDVGELKASLRS